MAFAYSGLAEIENQRTDEWLATTIAPSKTLQDTHDRLSDAATMAFAAVGLPANKKRHAFCGIGWGKTKWSDKLLPGQSIISNAMTKLGAWTEEAASAFNVTGRALSESRSHRVLPPIGAALHDDLHILDKNVGRCVDHGTTPLEIVRLLAEAIRRTASFNSSVGRSLLAIVIPKPSAEGGMHLMMTPVAPSGFDNIDHPMFFNIPAGTHDLRWSMPNFVCQGSVMVGGRFEDGSDPAG